MQEALFTAWLLSQGYDAQHWTSELLRLLRRRWRSQQAIKPDHRIIVDARGCSWPARVFRVKQQ